jgi:hypothetical protein
MSNNILEKIHKIKKSRLTPEQRIFLNFTFGIDKIKVKNQNSYRYFGVDNNIFIQYSELTCTVWVIEELWEKFYYECRMKDDEISEFIKESVKKYNIFNGEIIHVWMEQKDSSNWDYLVKSSR